MVPGPQGHQITPFGKHEGSVTFKKPHFNDIKIWTMKMTLRADTAQSNYRACSIFGSTSTSVLGPFSILFVEYDS